MSTQTKAERHPSNRVLTPHLRHTQASSQLVVDGAPFLVLGAEIHNSSFSNPEYMAQIWPRLKAMNINTVLASVSWELVEPVEGQFNFSAMDEAIQGARATGLRLVLLWFGAYKNALSSYVPPWVRKDVRRFPRMHLKERNGALKTIEALQPYNEHLQNADARAFAALMAHLREFDRNHNTVIMMQVENEVGLLYESRDRSSRATSLYNEPVPQGLLNHLKNNYHSLHPTFCAKFSLSSLEKEGSPTWLEAFGGGPWAEDAFMADALSRFCQKVAAAGRAEHDIPIFMNVALCSEEKDWADSTPIPDWVPEGDVPGQFPSGGPVGHNLDIYRYNAPDVAFYAPDIYLQNYEKVCECFHDGKQPLFIPEQRRDDYGLRRMWSAYGNYQAIGCSPFGIDSLPSGDDSLVALHFKLLGGVSAYILEAQAKGPGHIMGFFFDERGSKEERTWSSVMGRFRVNIQRALVFGDPKTAAGMVIWEGDDRYLVVGYGFQVVFKSVEPKSTFAGILEADEMRPDGKGGLEWVRRLNGDETQHGKVLTMPGQDPDYDGFPIPCLSPAGTMMARCTPYSLEETEGDW